MAKHRCSCGEKAHKQCANCKAWFCQTCMKHHGPTCHKGGRSFALLAIVLVSVLVLVAFALVACAPAPIPAPTPKWEWNYEADYVSTSIEDPSADKIWVRGFKTVVSEQKPEAFCPLTYPWGDKFYNLVSETCQKTEPKVVGHPGANPPSVAPTLDPNRIVWVWRFSAKYARGLLDPESDLISLTSRGIKEGPDEPSLPSCSEAIYQGVERLSIRHGTCRTGKIQRVIASRVDVDFPVLWGVYLENP